MIFLLSLSSSSALKIKNSWTTSAHEVYLIWYGKAMIDHEPQDTLVWWESVLTSKVERNLVCFFKEDIYSLYGCREENLSEY